MDRNRRGAGPRGHCLVLLLTLALVLPTSAPAQGTVVGAVLGAARTEQLWKPDLPTDRYTGPVLGAFADAATPVPWLVLRVEGSWTRRGGDVVIDIAGQPTPGRLRMDYFSFALHAKLGWSLGPADVIVTAGPTVDQVLKSTLDSALSQVFDEQKTQVFGVAAGAGLEAWVTERIRAGVEVRLTEGLSDSYDGPFISVRNRSVEGLLRVGIPLSVLRGS